MRKSQGRGTKASTIPLASWEMGFETNISKPWPGPQHFPILAFSPQEKPWAVWQVLFQDEGEDEEKVGW